MKQIGLVRELRITVFVQVRGTKERQATFLVRVLAKLCNVQSQCQGSWRSNALQKVRSVAELGANCGTSDHRYAQRPPKIITHNINF